MTDLAGPDVPGPVPTPHGDMPGASATRRRTALFRKVQGWLRSPWVIALMGAALVWALFQVAPWPEWKRAFAEADPLWLVPAVALVLAHELLKVGRMEQLVPCVRDSRLRHARIVYGMACVAQLPVGTVGGDLYRVMRLEECGADPKDATAATFLIRMIGFSTTLTLAGLAGVYVLDSVWPLIGPLLAAVILWLLASSQNPPAFVGRLVARADDTGSGRWGRFISLAARLIRHVFREAADLTRAQMLRVLGYTLALYGLRATIAWFCLLAMEIDVSWLAALAALAAGNLASSVPSPTGNVGLREGGMVGVLAGLGIAVAPAAIGALLFRACMVAGAGLGLLVTGMAAKLTGP
ncbi:lysylphosphatidylglycerol synthase transmembrane domain-containing protein [uncultured Algimonas sp.]|uniref:lysylphosphatidylglycerol synthase transmembrane domain-containing protein n=1 Tax=uncultured Algimonas sp. TaxID=1547920 RepID=UPI0026266932|nr:lysylphosphatidylglycerol synthase transmembrane domain-containing protein [uncultured Algimonas sp.]